MKYLIAFSFLLMSTVVSAQKKTYNDSLKAFRDDYVKTHGVVKGDDAKFLNFFPIDKRYRAIATFKKETDTIGFNIPTTAGTTAHYYKYGSLSFKLNDSVCRLFLYRSQRLMGMAKYQDYLFLPFTDLTNANETYGAGRYIDILTTDIKNNKLIVDFNKAYNPYCAYGKGFQCPLPPKECALNISVYAGEKSYGKPVH